MEDFSTKLAWLHQENCLNFIENKVGKEPWTTVYLSRKSDIEKAVFFCALIPDAKIEDVFNNESWDSTIDSGMPGCITYGDKDSETKYFRFGDDDDIEPLVLCRDFHGIKHSYQEVSEEFRLFHNLFYDSKNNKYVKIDEDGNEEDIIILGDKEVKIKLKEIKQFIAVKEMHLAFYFDIIRYSNETLEELELNEFTELQKKEKMLYRISIGKCDSLTSDGHKSFSLIIGKKLIAGVSKDNSGIYPYEKQKKYTDFIIRVDENGENVTYNCHPKKLLNSFGANPDAPHYLTPVFFRREVLNKYYTNPEKFSVEDSYLRCSGLWDLRMDNNHEKYVMVFLGDLGQDLSYNEQLYWKNFNIAPDGVRISSVAWKRGFLVEFAEPEKADLLFKYRFELFQSRWIKKFGWPLFIPLATEDQHNYKALRIPLTNDQAEFDSQVLGLAKVFIDSLNDKRLQKVIITKVKDEKSISKFERFLAFKDLTDFQEHIKFMRNLWDLRDGVGHRKGKKFKKIAVVFQLYERDLMVVFEDILINAIILLQYLEERLLINDECKLNLSEN